LAPFTPFLAEELYQKLTGGESVHLLYWPELGTIDETVISKMEMVRKYIEDGLRQRAVQGIKIRQPLASAEIGAYVGFLDDDLLSIMQEELNIKGIVQRQDAINDTPNTTYDIKIDWNITPELKREGLMREVIRYVQAARKKAGLNVDDRIVLSLLVKPGEAEELEKAIEEHSKTISEETLTSEFADVQDGYDETVRIDDNELRICLKKA
jgi:isoleucyl-tRNA synthetase